LRAEACLHGCFFLPKCLLLTVLAAGCLLLVAVVAVAVAVTVKYTGMRWRMVFSVYLNRALVARRAGSKPNQAAVLLWEASSEQNVNS